MLDDPWQCLTICFILTFIEALVTAGETSIFTVSENRLEHLAAEGRATAKEALAMQREQYGGSQQIILFSHYLLHFLLGAAVLHPWMLPLYELLLVNRFPAPLAVLIAMLLVALPTAMLVFILGRLLPRRWALRNPEGMALLLVRPLRRLLSLLRPVEPVLNLLYKGITRIFGDRDSDPVDEVTEEEIKAFVAEHGSIAEEEKDLIHSVFEFGDVSVGELMVPRIDIEALEENRTVGEALALFRESGYSRLPVYQETIDHIVGIINLKDILNAWMENRGEESVRSCLYPTLIVPEQKMALELLHEMQRSRLQMAIVTDEFGGTAGLITVEDLVEQVVGEIRDETDSDEQDEISVISPLEARVLGVTPVHSLNDELGWRLPEAEDYDTVGGLVFSLLGRIPQEGDSVEVESYLLRVEKMDRRRIEMLHIVKQVMNEEIGQ